MMAQIVRLRRLRRDPEALGGGIRPGRQAYNPPAEFPSVEDRLTIDLSKFEEAVNSALADGNPCLVAAADKSGQPDIAFKGSAMVFDGEHMAWWERSLSEQIEQVSQNPKVCI